MPSYDDFEPNRIKHMEMIQAVVARLAGNSFLIKGWALTLTGAFLGFGIDKNDWALAAMAFLPILVFGALDTYYLWAERRFRVHHDRVRTNPQAVEPFSMSPPRDGDVKSWVRTLSRPTLWGFYPPSCPGLLLHHRTHLFRLRITGLSRTLRESARRRLLNQPREDRPSEARSHRSRHLAIGGTTWRCR